MNWTEDHDNVLKTSLKDGLSASLISERLNQKFRTNITRNAVLGRIFRLGLCVAIPEQPTKPRQAKKRVLVPKFNFMEHVETIKDMRDAGFTWEQIGLAIGRSGPWTRNQFINAGMYDPVTSPWFSIEDKQYIIKAWNDHVPVEDIADALNRSFGSIRQQIHRLKRNGLLHQRDGAKTRLLKQYGEKALSMGATPSEALHAMANAKREAFASAQKFARDMRYRNQTAALDRLKENLAQGMERNEALFQARAEGATLEQIGQFFGITRERVRQVCLEQAELIVLKQIENKD